MPNPKIALLASRAVIRVAGPDARAFLKGLLTQDAPEPGRAAFAALLTPQGKILFDFLMAGVEDGVLLDCDAAAADALLKRLMLYRLRAKATIERLADRSVGVMLGERADTTLDVIRFHDPRLIGLGERIIGPSVALAGAEAAEADYDRTRIALGVPEFGKDFGADEVFLLDVNYDALHGVDYKKGCFVGQEVTSRMKRKGEIRKRTLRLSFDGPPPAKGAAVTAGASILGEVLSGTDGMALALIRLDRLAAARAAGAPIEAEGRDVRIDIPAYLERG